MRIGRLGSVDGGAIRHNDDEEGDAYGYDQPDLSVTGRAIGVPSSSGRGDSFRVPLIDGQTAHESDSEGEFPEEWHDSMPMTPFTRSPVMFFRERFSAGSIKGSIFTLVVAIVGAGTLSVPLAMERAGLLLGCMLFILGGMLAFFSLQLLIISSELAGVKSYSGIANVLYGPKADVFAQSCLLLNLYGTSISYIVASGSMLSQVLLVAFGKQGTDAVPFYLSRKFIMVFTTTAVVIPLCLLRTMGALRFSSLIAVGCSAYLTIVVTVQYFGMCTGNNQDVVCFWEDQPPGDPISLAEFDLGRLLAAVPIVVYAYTCHPNVLPIFMELQKPTRMRMTKVVGRAIGAACIMYVILGSFAYLTFKTDLQNSEGNFLNNYKNPDASVIIGAIGMSLSVVLAIPLFVNAFRSNIYRLINGEGADVLHASTVMHASISVGFVLAALLPAILIKDISMVFQVLGSTTNPVICFVLPALFIVRAAPSNMYRTEKLLSVIVALVISLISISALITNIRSW